MVKKPLNFFWKNLHNKGLGFEKKSQTCRKFPDLQNKQKGLVYHMINLQKYEGPNTKFEEFVAFKKNL